MGTLGERKASYCFNFTHTAVALHRIATRRRCLSQSSAVFFKGLDAPLLPLKQSDMCLVCIAFASWVLKTANPQVGDAWKAGMFYINEIQISNHVFIYFYKPQ